MPTFKHGKSAYFALDNGAASPTLTDISAVLQDVGLGRGLDMGETTSFGSNAKTYITGLADSTISISGKYDSTFDSNFQTAISNLQSGTITSLNFEYRTNNAVVGATNPKWTGTALIKSYEVKSTVADVVSFSLELQVTGAVTRATS